MDSLSRALTQHHARPAAGTLRPAARWGFAVAAPVLAMAGGQRTITLILGAEAGAFQAFWQALQGANHPSATRAAWAGAFEARATGPQGWVPLAVQAAVLCEASASVRWTLHLREDQPALTGYAAAAHGPGFDTSWPVLQFIGHPGTHAAGAVLPFSGLQLGVRVRGLRALHLSNQMGPLNSSGPFHPFGPQGLARDYLLLGAPELAHKKRVHHAKVRLTWQHLPSAPGGFAAYYAGYGQALTDASFQVEAAHWADGAWHATAPKPLFRCARAGGLATDTILPFGVVPAFDPTAAAPQLRLLLTAPTCGFGAGLYPQAVADAVRRNAREERPLLLPAPGPPAADIPLPMSPFVPLVQRAALSYRAEAVWHPGLLPDEQEVRFYHLTAHAITEPVEGEPLLPTEGADTSLPR